MWEKYTARFTFEIKYNIIIKGGDYLKTLVLSDVHANAPALRAVLQKAGKCDRIIFLGDLANFGPHPAECVEILKETRPICIMGNHDEQIASETPKNFWDKWSRQQLREDQLKWISTFKDMCVLDGHILLVHGSYEVDYDILPNTPDKDIQTAFKHLLTPEIDQVWFGHYHYQVDRTIDGINYHCIRPVGHHRDKDPRASYYFYEDGVLTQHRVKYELSKTIQDFKNLNIFDEGERKQQFVELLQNAFEENLLKKDIEQMQKNQRAR